MVRIGVISDTHMPAGSKGKLPEEILEKFSDVDLILHAGDVIDVRILKQLEKLAPVIAVKGNMDLSGPTSNLPEKVVKEVEGVKIGLIHGWGPPSGIVERIKTKFSEPVNVIVFGHTHSPMAEWIDGMFFFNPGSATDRVYTLYNSVGLLTIDGKEVNGEIIEL